MSERFHDSRWAHFETFPLWPRKPYVFFRINRATVALTMISSLGDVALYIRGLESGTLFEGVIRRKQYRLLLHDAAASKMRFVLLDDRTRTDSMYFGEGATLPGGYIYGSTVYLFDFDRRQVVKMAYVDFGLTANVSDIKEIVSFGAFFQCSAEPLELAPAPPAPPFPGK